MPCYKKEDINLKKPLTCVSFQVKHTKSSLIMADRKAELERKKERLRQMREEKERRRKEKEKQVMLLTFSNRGSHLFVIVDP